MARIILPTNALTITPTNPSVNSPVNIEVRYTIEFTPMEMLLAQHGLRFTNRVRLVEVNNPPDNDDFLLTAANQVISSGTIQGAVNNRLQRLIALTDVPRSSLRGNDETPTLERVMARISIRPVPLNAASVVPDDADSNIVFVQIQDEIIEAG
jgi:hypothetical protein